MPEIIFDNCVLSNFAVSEALEVLKTLYPNTAHITEFVAAENMKGIAQGHNGLVAIRQALRDGWITEITLKGKAEKRLFESLSMSLGLGEASSMAAAKARSFVFACDDRMARKESELLGIKLTGTIGILVRAVRNKAVNGKKADEILTTMIRHGFYSPVASIRELL
jgi:predicted nucleic acid-binding protein